MSSLLDVRINMEKIAIIGDIHLGKHSSDQVRRESIEKGQDDFFENQLVPELKEKGISKIYFTGDIHDHRTQLNVRVACRTRRLFKDVLKDFDITIVQGNHDLYYKNSYEYSSLELFEDIPNVTIYSEKGKSITELNKKWYIIPWIIQERESDFIEFLKRLSNRPAEDINNTVVFGHFELNGVKMEGNNVSVHGMDTKYLLKAAKLTISGHYHGKSESIVDDNRLLYVGSPYQLTFINAKDEHGYYILNEDLSYEFIENKVSPRFLNLTDTDDIDNIESLENYFVNIHYNSAMSEEEFLALTTRIDSLTPITKSYIPYSRKEDIEIEDDDAENEELISTDMRYLSKLIIDNDSNLDLDKDQLMEKISEVLDTLNL